MPTASPISFSGPGDQHPGQDGVARHVEHFGSRSLPLATPAFMSPSVTDRRLNECHRKSAWQWFRWRPGPGSNPASAATGATDPGRQIALRMVNAQLNR
jgi:hypothetical protein